jgi:hypothetical protein
MEPPTMPPNCTGSPRHAVALLEVAADHDRRLLRWVFRCGPATVVLRSLRNHPLITDRQVLGLVGCEPDLPGNIDGQIQQRIAELLPVLRFAQRGTS